MGSEPVFGALFAWLIFGETLSGWAWVGCGLILLIRPDDVLSSVRAEPVETLRRAQGERFILYRAESVVATGARLDRTGTASSQPANIDDGDVDF